LVPADAECLADDEELDSLPGATVAISAATPANQTAVQQYPACSGIMTRFGNSQPISSWSGVSVGTVVQAVALSFDRALNPFLSAAVT